MLDSIAHAGTHWLITCLVAAGIGAWQGFRALLRSRMIEDVPTAKIRSAAQGQVELIGEAIAMDGEPIFAPLSKVTCCWYSYRIEQRDGKNWRLRDSGNSDAIFILRDATGDCIVDPDGAEVTTVHSQTWFARDFHDSMPRPYQRFDLRGRRKRRVGFLGGLFGAGVNLIGFGNYRFTEKVILGHDPLYAIGYFKSLTPLDHAVGRNEITRAILREWKANPGLLRERFDADGDGRIDLDEWEAAREAAKAQAGQEYRASAPDGPIHTLAHPPGRRRRHFLLSNLPEFELVGHFTLRQWLGFGTFFLAGGAATLMLATRF